MLFTVLTLFVVALVLSGLLWAGALVLQGWLYETPAGDLYWRAPAVGAGLAVFYGLWVFVDCGTAGHCGSMYKVSVSTLKQYDQLRAVVKRNGKDSEETYRKQPHIGDNGFDYVVVGPDGQLGNTKLTETPERILIEEDRTITVKPESGEAREFHIPATAKVTIDGKEARPADVNVSAVVAVSADPAGKVTAVAVGGSAPPSGSTATVGKVTRAEGGTTAVFVPQREGDKFKRESGQDLYYYDPGGRFIDEGNLGQVQQLHWDWLLWNIVFNVLHLGLWFAGLWLVLRFQWSHALGFAVCLWLTMTLLPLPMMLDFAEKAFLVL